MKNIHIRTTNNKCTKIGMFVDTNNFYLRNTNDIPRGEDVEIYITNDEQIKEGDAIYDDDGDIGWAIGTEASEWVGCKKIVLTTDEKFIKRGIQAIDDEFLEWFVKNPSCEFVEVANDTLTVKEMIKLPLGTRNHKYKIIIPQEEPKQIKCYCGHTTYCDCIPQEISEEAKQRARNYMSLKGALEPTPFNLDEMESKINEALSKETEESLTDWLNSKRKSSETLEDKRSYQKHSLTKTKGYKLWCNIIQRCYNPKNHSYKYYGGKGVIMEDYFKNSYENFINWIKGLANYEDWLNSSELSLDRIDNTLGYIRGNIKFSTKTEQVENQNLRIDNKSGYKGVCYHKINKKYGATITINKSKIFLGYYDTALEAALVYDNYVLKNNLNRKTNL